MPKQNSVNLDITNNADGFTMAGGTTPRSLGVSGGDILLVGSGSATLTFPTTSTTIAGLGIAQTFTAIQSFGQGSSAAGEIRLLEDTDDGSNYTGLRGSARSANITYVMPTSDPTAGQVLSAGAPSSNVSTLSWVSAGAGIKTYAVFTPLDNQPPATNYATFDTRNSIAVLDFDASTDESAVFVGIMPEAASLASGLKIRIHWMATSATSGACRWGVQIERMNTDEDSDSFDTAATAGTTTNGTSGIVTATEITITTIDSIAAGEPYRLKVYRDADGTSGTDDMTGDAELVAVEVRSAA